MNDYIFNFEDLPSKNTPLNASTFEAMQKKLLDSVYPIGRGFIDFTNTDYSNYLGFTWERELVGLTPVGYNAGDTDFNQIGKTGGEKTHTLTIAEMPSHTHDLNNGYIHYQFGDEFSHRDGVGSWTFGSGIYSIANTGGDKPHNNMQPYKVVAYWKRVA